MNWRVAHGDCVDEMKKVDAESIDAIVCDPPYLIEFMGREWDGAAKTGREMQAWHEAWCREALRVLKPGGHLLAFGGTRTYHRLAAGIEDAGFEIRDCLSWLYGSGFPKSLDVSKAIDKAACAEREVVGVDPSRAARLVNQIDDYETEAGWSAGNRSVDITAPATPDAERWQGWGTALKPAWEPIVLARKPLVGTVAANVLRHGTGALNVDGCRIGGGGQLKWSEPRDMGYHGGTDSDAEATANALGRWPANITLDAEAAAMLDEQSGELVSGAHSPDERRHAAGGNGNTHGAMAGVVGAWHGDSGGASRFFYVAKPSTAERSAGLDGFEAKARPGDSAWIPKCEACGGNLNANERDVTPCCGVGVRWETPTPTRNVHPTVKPIELMRWLVRLVTPPGGIILDPFAGSGTTGCAAVLEGFEFVGIERDAEYIEIARARIEWWAKRPGAPTAKALVAGRKDDDREAVGQLGLL